MPQNNPLENLISSISISDKISILGNALIITAISLILAGLIALLVSVKLTKKRYWINIEVSRTIGGKPMRVGEYVAKEVVISPAGDKIWRVCGKGLFDKLKVIKWIPAGKIQSGARLFKYYIREDGEWINYGDENLDEVSKKMGIKFVQEDMRLQRLALSKLLEQRFGNKTFWEKWGTTIMTFILFFVVAICMVIIFYQWSKLLDKQVQIEQIQSETSKILLRVFGENYITETKTSYYSQENQQGLIPAG